MARNAVMIDGRDSVVVVVIPVKSGQTVFYETPEGEARSVVAREDIPCYHKIAVRAMAKGEPVVKYGEHIGLAGKDIAAGDYVHLHNVASHRENLGG